MDVKYKVALIKIPHFLFLAVFMLAVKPFVGFNAFKGIEQGKTPRLFVKSFTKRKQEYIEDSDLDMSTVQKRFADPFVGLTLLFSFLLNTLFPSIFRKPQSVIAGILVNNHLSLFPPQPRYLLSGKLII